MPHRLTFSARPTGSFRGAEGVLRPSPADGTYPAAARAHSAPYRHRHPPTPPDPGPEWRFLPAPVRDRPATPLL